MFAHPIPFCKHLLVIGMAEWVAGWMAGWMTGWMDGMQQESRSRRDQPLHCSGPSFLHRTCLLNSIITLPAASLMGSAGSRQILPFVPN